METLTTILHELRNGQIRVGDVSMARDGVVLEPSSRRSRDEEIPSVKGHIFRKRSSGVGNQSLGERNHETRGQLHSGQNSGNDNREANTEESELKQHLHDIKQERDQLTTRDPGRAMELEGEERQLVQIIDKMQGSRKPPSWRIKLDDESPFSVEIMGTMIPRDFHFPDLKYSGRSDPLMHIERFNDMTGV